MLLSAVNISLKPKLDFRSVLLKPSGMPDLGRHVIKPTGVLLLITGAALAIYTYSTGG